MVRADGNLQFDDGTLFVGLKDRVDAVLPPENIRPLGLRLHVTSRHVMSGAVAAAAAATIATGNSMSKVSAYVCTKPCQHVAGGEANEW